MSEHRIIFNVPICVDVIQQIYNMDVAEMGRVKREAERETTIQTTHLALSKSLHQRNGYCLRVRSDTKPEESNLQGKVKRTGLRKGKSGVEVRDFRITERLANICEFLFFSQCVFQKASSQNTKYLKWEVSNKYMENVSKVELTTTYYKLDRQGRQKVDLDQKCLNLL